jgi:Flp pilus assembly CpaF family ATPase
VNILIYGNQKSGKTIMAEALAAKYQAEKQATVIYDDSDYLTASSDVVEKNRKKIIGALLLTQSNLTNHSIFVSQMFPDMPALFDYIYKTYRLSPESIQRNTIQPREK